MKTDISLHQLVWHVPIFYFVNLCIFFSQYLRVKHSEKIIPLADKEQCQENTNMAAEGMLFLDSKHEMHFYVGYEF